MANVSLFFALHPDDQLSAELWHWKNRVRELVGPQLYLDHPPHLTTYLSSFPDLDLAKSVVQSVARQFVAPQVRICGWHVFALDVLTGNNTLVAEIDAEDKEAMRTIQTAVIAQAAAFRDVSASLARYQANFDNLSVGRQQAVHQLGFPFVGKDWEPHFTVASISTTDWDRVWRDVKDKPIHGDFYCSALALYQIENGNSVLLQKCEFQ